MAKDEEGEGQNGNNHHRRAFHVSGPRNINSPNWRDLINSSWKDGNYKRIVIACFIQAVYLLEHDRQENRNDENALAPKWWAPFKYKLTQTLIDERDNSIFGAILKWDRAAALSKFILMRPSGAPRAILVLRGTIVKTQTMKNDIVDNLRFLASENLEGSVRFNSSLEALKSLVNRYGSNNVCIVGHSLGAGFGLQLWKALAIQGIFVEAHLFNPPAVPLAMSLRNLREKVGFLRKRIKSMLPSSSENQVINEAEKSFPIGSEKWVPHLYVNDSDYICCYYTNLAGDENSAEKENVNQANGNLVAKLFVLSKGKQKFLDAHGLEQWWSDDLELQLKTISL